MELTAFYASVSGVGFTLLGLWWVVVDRHAEWFERTDTALMAYVISLQFILPASSSLLSLVGQDIAWIWRSVFTLVGIVGIIGAVLVARLLGDSQPGISNLALVLSLPVYVGVILVALFPEIGSFADLTGLQLEALLFAMVLVLALHAVWFFSHHVTTTT